MRKQQSYINEFDTLVRAGVGVFITRTREMRRVCEELRAYTNNREDMDFKEWNTIHGWVSIPKVPAAPDGSPVGDSPRPVKDGKASIVQALAEIAPFDGGGFNDGIYVMHNVQFWMRDNAQVVQYLREYSWSFTSGERKRVLVLLVPEGFQLPRELEDDLTVLDFTPPGQAELAELLTTLLSDENEGECPYDEGEIIKLASAGQGMTIAEFEKVVARAVVEHDDTFPNTPADDFAEVILRAKTEVVKRSEVLEILPTRNMKEVAGMGNLKTWIGDRAICFTPEARDYGIDLPKGVLIVGVPGTGKTLIAMAVAGEFGLPLVQFKIGQCFGSYVGESEQRTDAALSYLKAMSPCVAFVDELDKAGFGGSGHESSGVSDRVLAQILTFMQSSGAPIFWMMTANHVGRIDPALTRKGRLDEIFGVGLPNATERLEALKIHLRKRKQKVKRITDLELAVRASDGFVPAEIEVVVNNALIQAFKEGVAVTGRMIADQFATVRPYSIAFKDDYNTIKDWCSVNAIQASAPEVIGDSDGEEEPRSRRIERRRKPADVEEVKPTKRSRR